jgi:hypothetical protein
MIKHQLQQEKWNKKHAVRLWLQSRGDCGNYLKETQFPQSQFPQN